MIRIIPILLLKDGGLVKTVKFDKPTYIGDPINTVKIFNDKEADELIMIDIGVSRSGKRPDFDLLGRIAREAFMPLAYGGGIRQVEDARQLLGLGYEKILLDSQAVVKPEFITELAGIFGSQSVVVCLDVKRDVLANYRLFDYLNKKNHEFDPKVFALEMEKRGAGEIVIYSVDRDGTGQGYDLDLIKSVSSAVNIPVVALGGAGTIADFRRAVVEGGASAVAAGSLFVFHGPHRAVLLSYPKDVFEEQNSG